MSENVVAAFCIYLRIPLKSWICQRMMLGSLSYVRGCHWASCIFQRTSFRSLTYVRGYGSLAYVREQVVSTVIAIIVDDTVIAIVGEASCRSSLAEDVICLTHGQSGNGVLMKTISDVVSVMNSKVLLMQLMKKIVDYHYAKTVQRRHLN
jgi:hypothetical protein